MNRSALALGSALILTAAISGCQQPLATGIAPVVMGNQYTGAKPEEIRSIAPDTKELNLEQALQIAIANNPNFLKSFTSISAAKARYYASMSSYLPSLSAGYDYGMAGSSPQNRHNTSPGKSYANSSSVGLTSNWLLFDSLVREMDMLAAKHTLEQTRLLNADAKRLLTRAVILAYNDILFSREQIRIALQDLTFNQQLLKETQTKYDAGAVSLSEVLNFRIRMEDAQERHASAQSKERSGRYILAELMGLTSGDIPASVAFPPASALEAFVLADPGSYLDSALANRPDLKAMREALAASEFNVYSKYGTFGPTVSAIAGSNAGQYWGRSYPQYADSSRYSYNDRKWNWGIGADWVIFDGFKRWNRLKEAKANLEASQFDVAIRWTQVILEIRQAMENCKTNDELNKISLRKLELVKKNRELVESEYKAGNTTLTRINEAQRDLIAAETSSIQTRIELLNAKAQLEAAAGTQ